MHAPRVLREVEGDFEVRVTIPAIAPQPGRYFAAGLVVWCDDAPTFLRFMLGSSRSRRPFLHTESWSGTEYHGIKTTNELPEGPTQFRIRRTGDSLQLAWSQDGQAWIVLEPKAGPKLPARVRVGVTAIN